MLKLYHGTDQRSALSIINSGIDLSKSKKFLDFGPGFYMTDNIEKAKNWARRKASITNKRYMSSEKPYLVILEIDDTKFHSLKYKKFDSRDKNWANFIIANRIGYPTIIDQLGLTDCNLACQYDIVSGEIADGAVSNKAFLIRTDINEFKNFSLYDLLPQNGAHYGRQFSFHTDNALRCIISKKCDIIV